MDYGSGSWAGDRQAPWNEKDPAPLDLVKLELTRQDKMETLSDTVDLSDEYLSFLDELTDEEFEKEYQLQKVRP